MRFKTLVEPTVAQKGDEWLSPDGSSSTWRRVWNGTAWVEDLKAAGFPGTELSPSNPDLSNVGTDDEDEDDTEEEEESEDESEEEQPPAEEVKDEQRNETTVSDRNRVEQGSGGKPEPKSKQRGKRGKVRKGRKG